MTESERLRKEMEERGLLGTTGKKVIVSAAQKEINEKKGGTAKSRSAGSASRTASKTTDSAKHVPDTNLFRGMQLNRPTARKEKSRLDRRKRSLGESETRTFWPPSLETRRQRQESAK